MGKLTPQRFSFPADGKAKQVLNQISNIMTNFKRK